MRRREFLRGLFAASVLARAVLAVFLPASPEAQPKAFEYIDDVNPNYAAFRHALKTLCEQGFRHPHPDGRCLLHVEHTKETCVDASKLVSVAKPVKQKPKAYSDAEIKKLFEAMTDEEYERYAFFLATGCREQEVMFATWDDIDFAGKTYKVEGKSIDSENSCRRITKCA